jgi:predicted RNA-binding protein YlqC (UPF0109 family)
VVDVNVILLDLIKPFIRSPERCTVSQVDGYPMGYEVRVAESDYKLVLSRISVIKRLAEALAGLPKGQHIVMNVIPV